MLDRNLFLDDFDATVRRLSRKGVDAAQASELRMWLLKRRELTGEVNQMRAALNLRTAEIGKLIREGKSDEAASMRGEVGRERESLTAVEERLKEAEERSEALLMRIPNLPDDRAPDGLLETDNVVRRYEDFDENAYKGRTYRPHWDIATDLKLWDTDRAAKLSGSMFAMLRGDGARLLRALVALAMDLHRDKYEEILPAHAVRREVMVGTGHLPKFEAEVYSLRDDDLVLIPTGEVPLTAMHAGEIVPFNELPKRYMTYTACFRREAGAAGKDTRGMQRLHEFHKVELVRLCAAEQGEGEFAELLSDCERILKLLELPYRVVDLCCGDLTFSSARIFDLEAYAPGVDKWLEVSSVGMFTDFQARRANSRYRSQKGKPTFIHALNGSGVATPRVWAAILEHGQQDDGSVKIPPILVPYMGGKELLSRPER